MPLIATAEDGGASLGTSHFVNTLWVTGFYTDNFYNQPTPGPTESTVGLLAHPAIAYSGSSGAIEGKALVEGEYGVFDTPGSADNYLDGGASVTLGLDFSTLSRVTLNGEARQSHDPFGVSRTDVPTVRDKDLDRWNQTDGSLHYRFGAAGATMNAEVGIAGLRKHYITNETDTMFLDYQTTAEDYALFYNFGPKTATLVDFIRTQVDFPNRFDDPSKNAATPPLPPDDRAGVEYQIRFGAKWQATAKTSGDVRVGARRRTFDSGAAELQGVDWQASLEWSPMSLSLFRVKTGRTEQESYRVDARTIDVQFGKVEWLQTWSLRAKTTLGATFSRNHFLGTLTGSERMDRAYGANLGAEYQALSWLAVAASVNYVDQQSNASVHKFNRLDSYLGVRLGY